jgi:NTE family protein
MTQGFRERNRFLDAAIGMAAVALAGCASPLLNNAPINTALGDLPNGDAHRIASLGAAPQESGTIVGLALSGGGTRAAAFSFGVLKGLDEIRIIEGGRSARLIDRIAFVSGVSGGAVTAAYFGLRGRAAFDDFRERFLIRDVEAALNTEPFLPTNLARLYQGGLNDRGNLSAWLDANLFQGATFADLNKPGRPPTWINATDIRNRTPFVFERSTFNALCSDLDSFPLADAVAASAAVPLIFAPTVIKNFSASCSAPLPNWAQAAVDDPDAPQAVQVMARMLKAYRNVGAQGYVKLLDGGITDNFGLTSLVLMSSGASGAGPLTPREAVRLRRLLFIVIDADGASDPNWSRRPSGPELLDLVMAVSDTAIASATRASFDNFRTMLARAERDLVRYRCRLTSEQLRRIGGTPNGWDCRDVQFVLHRVTLAGSARGKPGLLAVPTRFTLPVSDVDDLIAAGAEAVQRAGLVDAGGAIPRARASAASDDTRIGSPKPTSTANTGDRP